jgi:hypothetical protein
MLDQINLIFLDPAVQPALNEVYSAINMANL